MTWTPLSLTELREIIARDLAACSNEERAYFETVAFEPTRWLQSPYGDDSGGFWANAADQDRVLWYNDIEEGFNVSRFTTWGTIPSDEYWCNEDPMAWALARLRTELNPLGG